MTDQKQQKRTQWMNNAKFLNQAMQTVTSIAITTIGIALLAIFIGKKVDQTLGTTPWMLILFALIGTVLSIVGTFVITTHAIKKLPIQQERSKPETSGKEKTDE